MGTTAQTTRNFDQGFLAERAGRILIAESFHHPLGWYELVTRLRGEVGSAYRFVTISALEEFITLQKDYYRKDGWKINNLTRI